MQATLLPHAVNKTEKRRRPDNIERCTIHGFKSRLHPHPIYRAWSAMWTRCTNPKRKDWKNYGGRGITVCHRWRSFVKFAEDMLPSWKRGLTIERKNNLLGYSKSNCVWSTRLDQNRNKRNVGPISLNGVSLFARDWAKKLGGNPDLIYVRLGRGWSVERACTTPV
jgi:hypothetical protein